MKPLQRGVISHSNFLQAIVVAVVSALVYFGQTLSYRLSLAFVVSTYLTGRPLVQRKSYKV